MSVFGQGPPPRRYAKAECCRVKIPRSDFNLKSLERSSARHGAPRIGAVMRVLIAAIALLVLGVLGWYSGYAKEAQGQLLCEGPGGVVINVDGEDYAVNGMAGRRYPPIERIWNSATHPEADIGG